MTNLGPKHRWLSSFTSKPEGCSRFQPVPRTWNHMAGWAGSFTTLFWKMNNHITTHNTPSNTGSFLSCRFPNHQNSKIEGPPPHWQAKDLMRHRPATMGHQEEAICLAISFLCAHLHVGCKNVTYIVSTFQF